MIAGAIVLLWLSPHETLRFYRQIGTRLSNSLRSLFPRDVLLCGVGVATGLCTAVWSSKAGFWGGTSRERTK
jgi:hypothetical protein